MKHNIITDLYKINIEKKCNTLRERHDNKKDGHDSYVRGNGAHNIRRNKDTTKSERRNH
jgi:hypothetical protein